jgi:hypothetical protein
MARIHAFEFEDQTWFPAVIREYMTDFLSHMGGWSKIPYQPFADRLALALERTGDARLVDLCSGGGGPAVVIARELQRQLATPAPSAMSMRVRHCPAGSSSKRGRSTLNGFRRSCTGFAWSAMAFTT